ncbi:Exopolyphosphatase OS=Streptomyces microflavus OX=1919 GN=Smic_46450 PE=4 SV=1 [Streptomyces microflavus]
MEAQFDDALERGGARRPEEVRWELVRTDRDDADTEERASALLRLVVRDRDSDAVGRACLRSRRRTGPRQLPGLPRHRPTRRGAPYGVSRPSTYRRGTSSTPPCCRTEAAKPLNHPPAPGCWRDLTEPPLPDPYPAGPTRRAPLGLVAGARSGDKGGDANVGVWVRDDDAWRWLAVPATPARFRGLLPETAELTVVRHVLPNLRALNFTVHGLLGEGVAAQARFDPQAKAVGERLCRGGCPFPDATRA